MKVGDLVKIVFNDIPFDLRPGEGNIGMIVEIRELNWHGIFYYVYINGVGWRYSEKELELLSGSG